MKNINFLEAVAVLIGTIIGAGILGIPYVVAQAGFLTGMLVLAVVGLMIIISALMLGEISLSTGQKHQLTGYAQKYLGNWGRRLMTFTMVFSIYGALIAYIIGEGEILSSLFGGSQFFYSLLFFALGAILVYFGLIIIKRFELWMNLIIFLIILFFIIWSWPIINWHNLKGFNIFKFFLPYGVILFAVTGGTAVPQAFEILVKQKNNFKKAIIFGFSIPLFIYAIFTFAVIGITGLQTTEIATIGLGKILGESVLILGNIFAFFAIGTSFLTLALALKQMYLYDYKMNKNLAWAITCFMPLILFLLGIQNFIKTIAIVGAVSGGIEGVLIVLMHQKVKEKADRNPEFFISKNKILAGVLIIIFILGIVYTLVNL